MSATSQNRYETIPFPWARTPIVDALHAARTRNMMHALIEVDVTVPRERLRDHKRRTGETLSFTAYIIGCVAKAVEEHKGMQALRKGARRLILFENVDICTPIEHHLGAEMQAAPYVIRAANRKPYLAIVHEIRAAQAAGMGNRWAMRARRLYPYAPRMLRAAFWKAFSRFPRVGQRVGGTVMVTAVGMFGKRGGWGISPVSDYTLQIVVGGIAEKPGVVDGRIEIRQYLSLTVSADHDVVEGGPMARFVARLGELIEEDYDLNLEAPSATDAVLATR